MTEKQTKYQSYLLRLWQVDKEGQQVWHASLEHPGSGERQGFADLQALFDFLAAQTEPKPVESILKKELLK